MVCQDYIKSKSITITKNDKSESIKIDYKDYDLIAVWTPPKKNAPFICIEPWYGRCDRAHYEGEYRDKDWMNRLAPGERFESVYTIRIA